MESFFQIFLRIATAIGIFIGYVIFRSAIEETVRRLITRRKLLPDSLTSKERKLFFWLGIPFLAGIQIIFSVFAGVLMAAIPFNLTESILSRTFFALAGSAFVFVPIAGLQFLLLFLPYAENQKLKRNRISPKGFLLDALGCFVTLTVLRWIFV